MKRYRVLAKRSGAWWALSVPEVPGAFSQVPHDQLDGAEAMIAEAVALMLDVDQSSFEVSLSPDDIDPLDYEAPHRG